MKKTSFSLILIYILFTSCVSKKGYAALEAKNKETQDLLNSATQKLNENLSEKDKLSIENESLKQTNKELIKNSTILISPIEYLIEFCCSNHNPSHCATKIQEMKDMCLEHKCIFK
jgi:cell division protein FtsB